jgi:hypothetical protein
MLASEKAGYKAARALVRSSDEAVESTVLSGHLAFGVLLAGRAFTSVDEPSRYRPGQALLLVHRTFTSLRARGQRAKVILFTPCGSND